MNLKKILIALSGGVDSSVAAVELKNKDYYLESCTMELFSNFKEQQLAQNISKKLNIKHHIFNFSKDFEKFVVKRFVEAYGAGLTPNPCVFCNRFIKFGKLLEKAESLGFNGLATGHYAEIEYSEKLGRWLLKKAKDPLKDQSYFLYSLNQSQLSKIVFPLGGLKKQEVREIAQKSGLISAKAKESQDICFVNGKKYSDFIKSYLKKDIPSGNFVDCFGKILGSHKGIVNYTVGQRKGLGLSFPEPRYVKKIDCLKNEIILTKKDELYEKKVVAKNINLIMVDDIKGEIKLTAKTRYRQKEALATVVQTSLDSFEVIFKTPQFAVARGQAVVLYYGDYVFGGGTIV